MEENKVKIKFGLIQQGHIETIESMLAKTGNNEYTWIEIGNKIGWCPKTACYHYIDYLKEKKSYVTAFAYWCGDNYRTVALDKWERWTNEGESYTTEELYKIFTEQKLGYE